MSGAEWPDDKWLLAGQVPQPEGAPGLEIHRALTSEELAELDESSELINRLSSNNAYARTVDLLVAAEQQHDALLAHDRPPPPAALGPLAAAIGAVCAALTEVPRSILSDTPKDLDDVAATQLTEAVEGLCETEAWKIAAGIVPVLADRRAHLSVRDGALYLTDAGAAALANQEGVSVPDEPILSQLREAALVGEEMVAERLLAYADLIGQHGLRVRRLAAEVDLGAPTAVRFVPGAEEGSRTLNFKPLPLDRIEFLYIAIRQSEQLRREPTEDDDELAIGDRDANDDEDGAAADGREPSGSAAAERAEDDGEDADDEDAADTEDAEVDENDLADTPLPEELPLDFASLIANAERIPTELERAWSEALDAIGLDEAHAALQARWQAVFTATVRLVQVAQERAAEAGRSRVMPFHPSDPAGLIALDVEGDQEARILAGMLGQTAGMQALVESFGRLGRKDQSAAVLRSPEDPSWWEAGAFAEARGRAFGLRRLTAELDAMENEGGGHAAGAAVPGPPAWSDRLRLAEEANDRGDYEAAVIHGWLGLRERAAQLAGVPLADVPDEFEDRLQADPELSEIARGFPLLRDLSRQALNGAPAPLGFYAHVASIVIRPLRRVCSGLSQTLPRAVHGTES